MSSMQDRIKFLEDIADQLLAGAFTTPTALGPGKLSKNVIKSKTITSTMIDATDLSAVKTNTGSLNVDGNLTIGTGGSLRSGKTSYTDTVNGGYYIGLDSGTPKIRVGNAGHTAGWTWDGSSLSITGSITASSGTIGGWTIGSTDLTADSGATGMASSGSYRLWIGDATPANAEFWVKSTGEMKATSGTIGGWTINNISGFVLGSGASTRGIDTGSTTFYAGSATPSSAPFRVSSTGSMTSTNATITGALTASSLSITGTASFSGGSMTLPNGGTITSSTVDLNQGTVSGMTIDGDLTVGSSGRILFGSGATDYLDDNILHFEVGTTVTQSIEFVNTGVASYSNIRSYANSFGSRIEMVGAGDNASDGMASVAAISSTSSGGYVELNTWDSVGNWQAGITVNAQNDGLVSIVNNMTGSGKDIILQLGGSGGSEQVKILDSGLAQVFGINSNGELVRPITNDGTALGAYYGRIPIYINGSLKYIGIYS